MFQALLAREFAPHGTLSAEQLLALENHFQLLVRWNERLNLTRVSSPQDAVKVHYCESLFLAKALPPVRLQIADVGSGAGFPGIPIAIARPECTVTLIESHKRKSVFLREASRNLPNVRILPERAEDVKESFDWVVSRAVTPSDVLALKLSSHFALLIGEADAAQLGGGVIAKVPWGDRRVLGMFHVEHSGRP